MVKVGDIIRDNDPRMLGLRDLEIYKVDSRYAYCRDHRYKAFPDTRILLSRIHTDGKPRRSGFSLVRGE